MSPLTLFGVLAVTAMLVFYALEDRSRVFILWFAGACAASSVYAFLQGAWPFGIVEAVWTGVAVERWRRHRPLDAREESRPIACNLSAFSPDERRRYDALRSRIASAIQDVQSTDRGFRLRVDTVIPPPEIAEWIALERRCCPFMDVSVAIKRDDTTWVELSGSRAVRDFLHEEFASVLGR